MKLENHIRKTKLWDGSEGEMAKNAMQFCIHFLPAFFRKK
jgi:hypothetical protein